MNEKLEAAFTAELIKSLEQAEKLTGVAETRLRQQAEAHGGVSAVSMMLKHRQTTRQYDALKKIHRLDLTPEALVTRGRFSPLFSDEEANACLTVLLQDGYYG